MYSGGDDLFIVEAWSVLPQLAARINTDLKRFGKGVVHACAGISLHGGKFPLYQAAEEGHRALEASKDVEGKDSVTFLGQTVRWDNWPRVIEIQQELLDLIANGANRSLLQVLSRLHSDYQEQRKTLQENGKGFASDGREQVAWGPWMWRGAYLLKRLETRSPEHLGSRIKQLREALGADDFRAIEVIGLAARRVEAQTRASKEKMEA